MSTPVPTRQQEAAADSANAVLPPPSLHDDSTSDPCVDAEVIEMSAPYSDRRTWPFRCAGALAQAFHWLFGLLSLMFTLAVLASLPLLQLLSLGYLLEASGRVARSGKLRNGFIGIDKASRIGSYALGTYLMWLPLRLASDFWYSAYLIDPNSEITQGWRVGLVVLTVVMAAHVLSAWYAGGRLRQFLWPLLAPFSLALWSLRRILRLLSPRRCETSHQPSFLRRLADDITGAPPLREWFVPAIVWDAFRRGDMFATCRQQIRGFFGSLRLPYYFSLGLRGFLGAACWLVVPLLLFVAATTVPPPAGVLAGLVGGLLLLLVLLYLPMLQAHFAAENRFRAMFEVGRVRALFRRAPIAFWLALLVTLLFALPLYLLKVELTPREVAFLPSLVFVAFILPARLLTGWAIGRGRAREEARNFVFRWFARLAALPVAGFYVLVVFFTRYTSWYGVWSLFEQHAFLIPVPFLGL